MSDNPENINQLVGKRIRVIRNIMGLSQTEVARRVGFTYQQLQKYEKGDNRIALDTLDGLCKALGTTMQSILEPGFDADKHDCNDVTDSDIIEILLAMVKKPQVRPKNSNLVSSSALQDKDIRASLQNLLRALDAKNHEKAE